MRALEKSFTLGDLEDLQTSRSDLLCTHSASVHYAQLFTTRKFKITLLHL